MSGIALILNPRSQRNRRKPLTIPPGLPAAAPETLPALHETLRGFAKQRIRTLIISGGDGTVREVLSALPQAYGDEPPAIALLASGNANVIASDVGSAGYGDAALERLVALGRAGGLKAQRRPVLEVRWPDAGRPPVHGFFMGAAALSRATRYAHEQVLAGGARHRISVALTIGGALMQALRGRDGWLDGEAMRIRIDQGVQRDGARFLFLATTLNRLVMGLWPFWNSGKDPLKYLEIQAPPRALLRSMLPLMRGRPTAGMLEDGYRSGGARRIELHSTQPLIIDGEVFAPGPSGVALLGPGPELSFLSP